MLVYLLQWTLGFDLHGSTYMGVIFNSKYCNTTLPTLVESSDVEAQYERSWDREEPQIRRNHVSGQL